MQVQIDNKVFESSEIFDMKIKIENLTELDISLFDKWQTCRRELSNEYKKDITTNNSLTRDRTLSGCIPILNLHLKEVIIYIDYFI